MPAHKVQTPIIKMMNKYSEEKTVRFHMPGHKGIWTSEYLKDLASAVNFDITEVPGTDNLHEPEGAIKDAETLLAKAYGVHKSFLLVNGATCGILASMVSAFKYKDKVIVAGNCHRSVFNAIELLGLSAIVVDNISPRKIRNILTYEDKCEGVVITRPDYYGICIDIKAISNICSENNVILITDEAHGAHLHFASGGYPESAVKYSDFTIQSAHKTLGAINQSAYLHLNNNGAYYSKIVRRQLSVFQTSSPSYLIMASGDCARAHMEENGAKLLEQLRVNVEWAVTEIESKTEFKVRTGQRLPEGVRQTPDRLVIDTSCAGFIGYSVEKYLRSRSIQVEMSDKDCIICLCSVFDSRSDFEKLITVLADMVDYADNFKYKNSEEKIKKEEVLKELYKQIGKTMPVDIIQYPPGVPIIRCGQVLIAPIYKKIEKLYLSGANILGLPKIDEDGGNL